MVIKLLLFHSEPALIQSQPNLADAFMNKKGAG